MSQLTNNFFVIDSKDQFSFGARQSTVFKPVSLEKPVSIVSVSAEAIAKPQMAQSDDTVEELNNKAKRLNHLLEVMPAGVIVLDQKGRIKQANQQAAELLGEPLEKELWREIILRSFKPQADDGHEVSLRDGRKVKISITPLVEEKGQLIVLTDLTETRELQSRISHLQRLSSLGKMVASLAHQVRTPLSSAMLYAANLRSLNLKNPMADRFTTNLQNRLKDLESQVNDMLLFAKSGEQQIVAPLTVSQVMANGAEAVDALLATKSIQLKLDKKPILHQLMGNETALTGAISNLLHNAIEVSQEGDVIEIITDIVEENGAPFISIQIKDQGCGLSEHQIDSIFEPFFTTKTQGTGLGLAVVKSVAKSHHGLVKAANNIEGKGACFTLLLPCIQPKNEFQTYSKDVHQGVAI
ncbi:sensor histidine kinase [Brumicola nitratireducens]|uniref:histidine kinase n=1 Tax=Glaciecola nitratireducens (strain JCM 12485 / KCTC 12276 / FR1064) TaxID=1085623 RepID=G4QLX5_GLANF|nr:ATP-binding protein [Glaciecola nitratireducens]AEP30465.1 putative sensory box sensor histidine kinase in two-component regulatory system [Glaciecola nitratireducens FR1064]